MSISTAYGSPGTIESATALFSRSPSRATLAKNSANHPQDMAKHQRAMAQRLEQLNAALGEEETSQTMPLTRPTTHENRRIHGIGTLLLTGILSALLGASLTWMAGPFGGEAPTKATSPQQTFTMSPPATPIEVPAPAATLKQESSDEQQVATLLENWRSAWTQRDTASYLNAYSKDFAPADGSTLASWVANRQKKLSTAAAIDVQVSELAIEHIDDSHIKATFRQDYASGNYRETARAKTLLVAREDGAWKITREWLEK